MADEPRYHDLTWQLMDDVANREVFRNLAQQRDAEYLLEQARYCRGRAAPLHHRPCRPTARRG